MNRRPFKEVVDNSNSVFVDRIFNDKTVEPRKKTIKKSEKEKDIKFDEIDIESILYYKDNLEFYENDKTKNRKKAYIVYLNKKMEEILNVQKKNRKMKRMFQIVACSFISFSILLYGSYRLFE